jgi:predicted nucleic acid-binding protein
MSLALFQRRLTLAEVQAAWQEVENDVAAGLLTGRGGLFHRVLADAETSAANDTPVIGTRTLDVLHVTAAKLIGVTEFCTFDTRQAGLAGRIGLTTVTP